jgi:hypothetical protein
MAKEMTIAKLNSSTAPANDVAGEGTADMFEAIFERLCGIFDQTSPSE